MPDPTSTATGSRTRRSISIGLAVTVAAMIATVSGGFNHLEHIAFDKRSQWFNHFTPPPSDRIVHVDIDDKALERWKRWPWPRADLAAVVDELHAAGAKVIAFDLLFSEPQEVRYVKPTDEPGAPIVAIEDDRVLAESIERAGNCVLALAAEALGARQPWQQAVVDELRKDLATGANEIGKRLSLTDAQVRDLTAGYRKYQLAAIRDCVAERLAQTGEQPDLETCLAMLLPNARDTIHVEAIEREHERIASVLHAAGRYPPAYRPDDRVLLTMPMPQLTRAARVVSSVSFERDSDGVVRTMPMWVVQHQRAVPHFALAVACLYLGVPPEKVRVEFGRTVIPDAHMPDGRRVDIAIPMIPERFNEYYAEYPHDRMIVTWPSNAPTWQRLYDPAEQEPTQHITIGLVARLASVRQAIDFNQNIADGAINKLTTDPELETTFPLAMRVGYIETRDRLQANDLDHDQRRALNAQRDRLRDRFVERVRPILEELESYDDLSEQELALKQTITDALAKLAEARAAIARDRAKVDQTGARLRQMVDGRICLIGWTATGSLTDQIHTALHPNTPGVVGHGALINAIVTGHFLQQAPVIANLLAMLLLGGAVTLITALMPPVRALVVSTLIGTAYFVFNGIVLFDYGNLVVAAAGPCLGGAAAWMAVTVYRLVVEQRERARITKQFKNYVSKDLVDLLVANPTLIKQGRHDLTCMFCDIAGFTSVTEQLDSQQMKELLNRYLRAMTLRIMEGRGTVNKYMGDCIMAFWGAPLDDDNHSVHACRSVLECFAALEELEEDEFFKNMPKLTIRFGIATGPMTVDDFGAPPERSDYTVIGDTVNLASRLEGANKAFDTKVLVNENTYELIRGEMLLRPIGRLQVVGKTRGVAVYELVNTHADATEAQRKLTEDTAAAVEAFQSKQFDRCIELMNKLAMDHGHSKLVEQYLNACQSYLEISPPDDFAGELVLSSK